MTLATQAKSTPISSDSSALVFETVDIYRARSFRAAHFKVGDLCGGINIIYGPNAAGKTTLARAFLTLIWPQEPELGRAELAGHFRVGAQTWRVDFNAGRVRYQFNGGDKSYGPSLPPADTRDRYYLGLSDLIDGKGEGFAAFIARESAGGYDVSAAADGLKYSVSIRPNNRRAETARAELRDAVAAQEELRREAGLLAELRRELKRAEEAKKRLELLQLAIEFGEADALHSAACERFAGFPVAMEQVRGDEAQQFDTLRERVLQADVEQKTARQRHEELSEAIEQSPLLRHPNLNPSNAEATLLDTVVPTLDGYLVELENFAREHAAGELNVVEAKAKAAEAWGLINKVVEPTSVNALSAKELKVISDLARNFDKVAGELWAYKKLARVLTTDKAVGSGALERWRDAARQLRGWLQTPSDEAGRESTQEAIKWMNAARYGALIAATLAAAISLFWGLNAQPVWPFMLATSLLFMLLFLAVTRALSRLRSQNKETESRKGRRDAYRRDFERSNCSAPRTWEPDAVEQRLYELEQQIAGGSIELEKASAWSHEQEAYQAIEHKQRALQQKRDELAARVGLDLDLHVGNQDILGFGGEVAELWWLISHIQLWQQATIEAKASAAALAKMHERLGKTLDKFRGEIRSYLDDSVSDARDIASAQAQTRALEKAARVLGQNLRDRRIAQSALEEGEARQSRTLAEARLLLERLQLGSKLDATPDIYNAEIARAIETLCGYLPAYERATHEKLTTQTNLDHLRMRIAARSDYRAELLKTPLDVLEQNIRELSDLAGSRDAVLNEIVRIETRVEAAKNSTAVEQKQADYQGALYQLSEDLEANDRRVTGAIVADFLQRETRDSTRPAVFQRARELFARITHGRYRLDLEDGERAQFRAFDTIKEIGQSLDELSSGTRVQLLLAVRVAFVEQQEQGAKLPLILDETLANSDDARARAIIEAVVQIAAEGRQIFYFTAQHDEVQKWRAVDATEDVKCKFIDLGAITSAPGVEASAAKEREEWGQAASAFEKIDLPSADGVSHADYKVALGIEGALDPKMPIGSVHIWYLTTDPHTVERLLRADISTWGALENLHQNDALSAIWLDDSEYARIEARAKTVGAFFEAWTIGRGRPVSRVNLKASGAVSEIFMDEVTSLSDVYQGSAAELLEALGRGEVKGFYKQKRRELAEYLEMTGVLDKREPLTDDQRWTRVLGEVAPEIAAGLLDVQDVHVLLARAMGG